MAEGRGRAEWERASAVLAMLYNTTRDPKKSKALTADDFNPYAARDRARGKPSEPLPLRNFKGLFVGD